MQVFLCNVTGTYDSANGNPEFKCLAPLEESHPNYSGIYDIEHWNLAESWKKIIL